MDDHVVKEHPKYHPLTLLAGGGLVFLYLVFCIITVVLGRKQLAAQSAPIPTPTITPAPHIVVHAPVDQATVLHEDFSSNERNWGLYYHYGKLEIINGKLILQSDVPNGFGVGASRQFAPSSEKYYVQADFSTDTDTTSPYGLIFGLNRSLGTYYVFEIWPKSSGYGLFKYNAGKWTELISFASLELSSYPMATTLSVYFDKGNMELYINGKLVSKYSDKDFFQSKDVGVFVGNTGYRLFVDDFFVFDVK